MPPLCGKSVRGPWHQDNDMTKLINKTVLVTQNWSVLRLDWEMPMN